MIAGKNRSGAFIINKGMQALRDISGVEVVGIVTERGPQAPKSSTYFVESGERFDFSSDWPPCF